MSKKRKTAAWLVGVIIVCTLAFIWGNSFATTETSSENSGAVYQAVKTTVDAVFGEDVVPVTHNGVRKFAHGFEFAALGAEICVLYILLRHPAEKRTFYGYFSLLPYGLYAAVIDEGIQILSARGPEVKDVFIDYAGYLIAYAVFFIVFLIKRVRTKNKRD
ncbi:MAG: VanZ family protein [Clostridia bacterium]|nr:VanZ family protein [Clostridia bacterium]